MIDEREGSTLSDRWWVQSRRVSARVATCALLVLSMLGWRTANADAGVRGDFNGDGRGDLAIAAPGEHVGATNAGEVMVLYGASGVGLRIPGTQKFSEETAGVPDTAESGDRFGGALAEGDFNGDGATDLAVGVPGEGIGSAGGAGQVAVLYGSHDLGLVASGAPAVSQGAAGVPDASEAGDHFGAALVVGDFDGDGRDDLAIGAPGESTAAGVHTGGVTVLYGSQQGLNTSGAQWFGAAGPRGGDQFGSVLAADDFNADARDDLAVGAPGGAAARRAVTVLYGSPRRLGTAGAQSVDGRADFGAALSVGDFNGDGSGDLAVGTPAGAGEVTVLYGSPTSALATAAPQALSQGSNGVPGTSDSGDHFGAALAGDDFNRDGRTDLAVGAPGETIGGERSAGQVTVLYGGARRLTTSGAQTFSQSPSTTDSNSEAGDLFGDALATGDFDGDGCGDLAIGAPGENTNSSSPTGPESAGQVTVLYARKSRLSTTDSQKLSEDTPGMSAQGEADELFGSAFPPSRGRAQGHVPAPPPEPASAPPPAPAPAPPPEPAPPAPAETGPAGPVPPSSDGAPAATPAPQAATPAPAGTQLPAESDAARLPAPADIAHVFLRRRLSVAELMRRGLRTSLAITPWPGSATRVVRVRVFDVGAGDRRRLVRTGYYVARTPGILKLTLRWRPLRAAASPGLYELEAAIGTSPHNLRKPTTVRFTLARPRTSP
jgi:FG-GAP repeat protein